MARFLRGTLTHALLQFLPDLPKAQWAQAAKAFVDRRGAELPARARTGIVKEVRAIFDDAVFGALFGSDSRAEVAFVAEIARPDGQKGAPLRVSGQIDRLVVGGDRVLIVDYKTNRAPPALVEAVPETYLLQLAAYRLALRKIYQKQAVEAAIVWTDGAVLMPIPVALLDAAEQRLWALEAAKR
ncbi:MAG: hypothetical protein RL291_1554 [Pseudomonadota bacterium]|jgi:ATP-dependent helicase/nuclease subunit A